MCTLLRLYAEHLKVCIQTIESITVIVYTGTSIQNINLLHDFIQTHTHTCSIIMDSTVDTDHNLEIFNTHTVKPV